jgi:transcriptional regulator with XRE-family HTH domain
MSPEDSTNLRLFVEMCCAPAHRAILAYQDQQGVDWFTSEHAERFLAREYYIVRRVLDGRERGVLCLSDLSFLDNQLSSFVPSGVYGLPGSRPVGAYFMSPSSSEPGFEPGLLHRLDEVAWPPANPVQELKEARGLSQKALAGLLSTSIHRVRSLLNDESPLSKRTARRLSELLDMPANRIQVAYDMHRSNTVLHVEYPGKWIDPRAVGAEDLPRGLGCVVVEINILSFKICSALLELLRADRIRIERCTYCRNLYLPKPRSHRHANNFCSEKHRKRYKYENP